jgi:uncharacterized protein YaaR (DUF327 family)
MKNIFKFKKTIIPFVHVEIDKLWVTSKAISGRGGGRRETFRICEAGLA